MDKKLKLTLNVVNLNTAIYMSFFSKSVMVDGKNCFTTPLLFVRIILVQTFLRTEVTTGVTIFSSQYQRSGGRRHSMSAQGIHIFLHDRHGAVIIYLLFTKNYSNSIHIHTHHRTCTRAIQSEETNSGNSVCLQLSTGRYIVV